MSSGGGGGKRPPAGEAPGVNGVLHQRRSLPMSPATMAVGGLLIAITIGYFTLYAKAKPGTRPSEVAKLSPPSGDGDRRSSSK